MNLGVLKSEEVTPRFCNHLGMSFAISAVATHVANTAKNDGRVEGRSPISVTSAAIYMTSLVTDTPKKLKDVAHVCEWE